MKQKSVSKQEIVYNDISSVPVYVAGGKFRDYEYQFPLHIHDETEILVALRGPIYVSSEKESCILNKNDVVLINRRVPHTTTYAPYACTNMLQFRLDKIESMLLGKTNIYLSYLMNDNQNDIVYLDSKHPVSEMLSKNIELMLTEKENKKKSYEIYIQAYIKLIIATLYRNNIFKDTSDSFSNDTVIKIWPVIKYIEENYNKKLSLDFLSSIINVNKSHLCRLFKKALDVTVIDYINFVRIWNAENLLTTTNENILEISMSVGFSNVSYFNRIFKKVTGMTPSAYKNIIYTKRATNHI